MSFELKKEGGGCQSVMRVRHDDVRDEYLSCCDMSGRSFH